MSMRWMEDDVAGLHHLCEDLLTKKSLVVELGSYCGESSLIFAKYAKMIYCIDPWVDTVEVGATADGSNFHYKDMREVEVKFDANTSAVHNIVKIRGYSDDLVVVFGNNRVSLVYIDSLHHYEQVRKDIDHWWPVVKPGGWLGGHNYGNYWPGVIQAVNETFHKPDYQWIDSSWAVQKKAGRRNA